MAIGSQANCDSLTELWSWTRLVPFAWHIGAPGLISGCLKSSGPLIRLVVRVLSEGAGAKCSGIPSTRFSGQSLGFLVRTLMRVFLWGPVSLDLAVPMCARNSCFGLAVCHGLCDGTHHFFSAVVGAQIVRPWFVQYLPTSKIQTEGLRLNSVSVITSFFSL